MEIVALPRSAMRLPGMNGSVNEPKKNKLKTYSLSIVFDAGAVMASAEGPPNVATISNEVK